MTQEERASKKQRELLSFVDSFIKGNGFGPSYREIMRALGYKSVSTVAVHIDGLIAKGYIIKRTHSARSLEVVTTDISAAPPVASDGNVHHAWLVEVITKQLEALDDTQKNDANHLLETLRLLGYEADALALRQRFEKLV